jgi:hypothetical protein
MRITSKDVQAVEIRAIKKIAPCGCCGSMVDRDQMWAMNTLFAAPDDSQKTRIRVRLCEGCYLKLIGEHKSMEWDNDKMVVSQ